MSTRTTSGSGAELRAIAGACYSDQAGDLAELLDAIRARFGARLQAIVYYGACLRDGDPYAGLVDLYVIVDRYGPPGQSRLGGLGNRLLAPNVYYLECAGACGTLRCKYAVLSAAQLQAGATRWFQTSIWGRFAQPVAIVHACDDAARGHVRAACGAAVVSLLDRALPLLEPGGAPADTFAAALALSYAGELRIERAGRGAHIAQRHAREYARRMGAAAPLLDFDMRIEPGRTRWTVSRSRRRRARLAWRLRRLHGKLISVARLAKACFTFSDAVDYAAFKVARHTGVQIELTDRLRAHPLIFGWAALWRAYRQRLLR